MNFLDSFTMMYLYCVCVCMTYTGITFQSFYQEIVIVSN